MRSKIHEKLVQRSREEPFSRLLGMEVVEIGPGSALVSMAARPDLGNMFGRTHGGALFSLIDEAFQLACNSHGILSVALNVSITYVSVPVPGCLLEARAQEMYKTNHTASYACEVREMEGGRLVATAQALAYRTGKKLGLP